MLKMSQVNYIRDLYNRGCRISEITRETGIDPKTIRKYISKDDFSEKPPIKTTHQSSLDEHKQTIDAWLEEDKKSWYKQIPLMFSRSIWIIFQKTSLKTVCGLCVT